MAINKNFVVSNGLEVDGVLIYADSETNRVGINTGTPEFDLDINGDLSFSGALSVGGTTGIPGQWLESTGDSVQWKTIPTLRVVERYTATEGQSIFPDTGFFPFESAEFIDVFVDGVKLAQDEYNTLVGNNRIELLAPAIAGETIELVAYNASAVSAGYTGIQGLTVAEEGVIVGLSDGVKLINFVGAYITAIGSGAGVTVFLDDRLAQDTNFWISNVSGLSTTTNVGIKNTSPARTLDVTGDARITSGLEAGSVFSSGVSTFSDVVIGGATTELVVTGDARITGILTIGTSSITLDGIKNEIKIGTALTLNQSGNAYVSGILTAQAFDGDGTNVSNVDSVTLAGLSSDSFIRSDANDSFSGTLSGTGSINISGVATASRVSATTGTITTFNSTTSNITTGNIVTGIVTTLSGTSFNYTGVSTATTLFSTTSNSSRANIVTGIVTNLSGTNASYSGIGTVGSLNIGATQVISSGRQLQNIASLDATTTATIESAIANAPNTITDLNVTGISTLGVTSVTNLTAQSINSSGITTTNSLNIGATQVISSGRQLQNIASLDATTTATIESAIANAPNTITDLNVTGVSTFAGITTVTGETLFSKQLNVSGIATASSFDGNITTTQITVVPENNLLINVEGMGQPYTYTFGSGGIANFPGNIEIGSGGYSFFEDGGVDSAIQANPVHNFKIHVGGYNNKVWAFSTDGSLSVPGDIIVNFGSVGIGTTNPQTKLDVSGTFSSTELRTKSVAEKTTLVDGNTISLVFNTGSGNIAICTNPTGDITLNVTNIPTDSSFNNHSISFSVIVQQTGTARTCTAVNLNGVSETIRWSGGSLENAISGISTTNGYNIFTFTGINTVGSASTTANYTILGSVSGGFN